MKAFIDFYKKEGISPVSQDVTDLEKHYRRRGALYRHLGMVPSLINGKSVLEFGPGSGHNALFTASLSPVSYVLVEGNPVGRERTGLLLEEYFPGNGFEIHESLIEDFADPRKFDLVICEGLLPMQVDPGSMVRHVGSFVAVGGCLVITCIDAVTYLPELLRRLVALMVTSPEDTTQAKLDKVMPIISPQLATIEGMNRPHEDYILDNLLQPFLGRRLFGVDEAIDVLSGSFSAYGTSPHYMQDWRWYKKVTGSPFEFNELHRMAYFESQHNFVDSRINPTRREASSNEALRRSCGTLYDQVLTYEEVRGDGQLAAIGDTLKLIEDELWKVKSLTGDSMKDFNRNYVQICSGRVPEAWGAFHDWFGQAQIYLSFIRV